MLAGNAGWGPGGKPEIPDKEVGMGSPGHAEVVTVNFDPAVGAFDEVQGAFFAIHDPTTLDWPGNDVGGQRRSEIFYHPLEQKAAGENKIRAVTVELASSIVTEVTPGSRFFRAEDYRPECFPLNGHQPTCQFVVSPKDSKLRTRLAAKRKAS
jgi:peptide-methionine (S)-S-oxide reductase